MKNALGTVMFAVIVCGVFSADEDTVKSVMEGESVTLNPDLTQTQGIYQKLWIFQQKESTSTENIQNVEILKGRWKMDEQTGSLTINNMRTKHSGVYILKFDRSSGARNIRFAVTVNEVPPIIKTYNVEMKNESVWKGDTVILQTGVTELHGDELIVWRFGDEGKLLAKEDKETKSSPYYNTDERFRHRLELNDLTGSLTIKDINATDAGLYTVKINSNKQIIYKIFTVAVTVPASGLSKSEKTWIVIFVALLGIAAAAAAATVFWYSRKISKLKKTMNNMSSKIKQLPNISNDLKQLSQDELLDVCENKSSQDELLDVCENKSLKDELLKIYKKLEELSIACNKDLPMISKHLTQLHEDIFERLIATLPSRTTSQADPGQVATLPSRTTSQADPGQVATLPSRTTSQADPGQAERNTYHTAVGENVTIKNETELLEDDRIEWYFDDILIFVNMSGNPLPAHNIIFKDELEVDKKTGSLTIKKITKNHSGEYKLNIISKRKTKPKATITFTVTVKTPYGKQVEGSAAEASPLLPEDGQDAVYANERMSPV